MLNSKSLKIYSKNLMERYPGNVPVIIKKSSNEKILQDIDKTKYLMPKNLTISEIVFIIRRKINLKPEEAIFIFVNGNILVPMNTTINEIYNTYKSDDDFLYMTYRSENVFG